MNIPDYSNKLEPVPILLHKNCQTLVIRLAGARMWCDKCQAQVDASQCYYAMRPIVTGKVEQ